MSTHQQYVNLGVLNPNQHLSPGTAFNPMQGQMQNMSPQTNNFQFPQQFPQQQGQMGLPMNAPAQGSHRRNQSALPNMGMGPPPAPSSGASGSSFGDFSQQNPSGIQSRENNGSRGGRGGHSGPAGGGHQRRHSLALVEAKKAAEIAQQKRTTSGFQFPIPGAAGASSADNQEEDPTEGDDKVVQSQQQGVTQNLLGGGLTARSGNRASAHGRSQSMAVGNNNRTQGQNRASAGFQFPAPSLPSDGGATLQPGQSDFQRRGSQGGHTRNSSRNFEGNWRQPSNTTSQDQPASSQGFNQNQVPSAGFQPGHRARGSVNQSMGSIGSFQYPGQPQLVQLPQGQMLLQQPQLFPGQQLNQLQLGQLQALQAAQMNGQQLSGLQGSQHAPPSLSASQQQQQRKTLFTPYLPQASLPALLGDGQLVAGVLRVNKKNRSDAYVTTQDGTLDADIFICGSKDRNRALEGDLVAVELLDVDEVWGQKREKEEKKKRKDITDTRGGGSQSNDRSHRNESSRAEDTTTTNGEGGLKRRGSLRQRTSQKKNDDVEVEGQSLLLVEEEEVNDEQKPLYAGHIVAVVERVAGQMFSGTLGLLRPSSQATKEKQEAERQAREGGSGRHQPERQQDKPKIVWFKPTDKRVPLIAIPTEQAPRDFVEKHQDYQNRIFVASIKRWPITSLHPFGTLVEQLGEMGDLKVETDALLRDNNFGADEFSEAVLKNVGFEDWSISKEDESSIAARRDFRHENTFTIDPNGAKELDDAIHVKHDADGKIEIGVHIADFAHFIKANTLVDREAKKRGTGVYLMNRTVDMLPPKLSSEICSLNPGQDRLTVSVVFKVDPQSGSIDPENLWIGKAIIKSSGMLSYKEVDAVLNGDKNIKLEGATVNKIQILDVSLVICLQMQNLTLQSVCLTKIPPGKTRYSIWQRRSSSSTVSIR
jgi:protein SSD1